MQLNEASPTYVDAWVVKDYDDFHLQFRLRIHLMTKQKDDPYGSDYPECANWLIVSAPEGVKINHISVDGHQAYTASYIYEEIEESEDIRVVAAINLDEKHYLAFNAQSYIEKRIFDSDFGKYALADMLSILYGLAEGIKILGNYSGVLRDIYVSRK